VQEGTVCFISFSPTDEERENKNTVETAEAIKVLGRDAHRGREDHHVAETIPYTAEKT